MESTNIFSPRLQSLIAPLKKQIANALVFAALSSIACNSLAATISVDDPAPDAVANGL